MQKELWVWRLLVVALVALFLVGSTQAAEQPKQVKYEYTVRVFGGLTRKGTEAKFNALGDGGWEWLGKGPNNRHIFMRVTQE